MRIRQVGPRIFTEHLGRKRMSQNSFSNQPIFTSFYFSLVKIFFVHFIVGGLILDLFLTVVELSNLGMEGKLKHKEKPKYFRNKDPEKFT